MKTEQNKIEQSKQSTLISFIKKEESDDNVDVMLLYKAPKYYVLTKLIWPLNKKKCKKDSCLELAPLSTLLCKYYLSIKKISINLEKKI